MARGVESFFQKIIFEVCRRARSRPIYDAIICTHESKETNSKGKKSWFILRSKMLFINSTQQRRRHRREEKNLNAEMRGKQKAWEKWDEKEIPGQSCENDDREKDENEFPDDGKFIDFSSFSSRLLSSLFFSTRRTMTTVSWWSFAVVS